MFSIPTVEISGVVESTVDGSLVPGAQVALVELNWDPGMVYDTSRTDENGRFTLSAVNLPVVEDCWGTAVSYWLNGEQSGWTGDKPLNPELIDVYETGDPEVHLAFPLFLYPP